jgi:hypothetical protein
MAVSWESASFIFRILGVQNQTSSAFATAAQLLILLAPLWVNAFAYMILGRMAYYWLPNKRIWKIKARTLTKYFVWADVVSFLVQAGGGSMISGTDQKMMMLGVHICKLHSTPVAEAYTDIDYRYGRYRPPAMLCLPILCPSNQVPPRSA